MRAATTRLTAVAMVLALAACTASTAMVAPKAPHRFRGEWQGTLFRASLPDAPEEWQWRDPLQIRIAISDDSVRVYLQDKNAWRQIKPGAFGISWLDTNAVIIAITTGSDSDGIWIETWSFAVSLVDINHLQTSFQRQVNNKHMHRSEPYAVFSAIAFGTLERTKEGDV